MFPELHLRLDGGEATAGDEHGRQRPSQAEEGTGVRSEETVTAGLLDLHHAGDVHVPERGAGTTALVRHVQRVEQEEGRGAAAVDAAQVGVDAVGLLAGHQLRLDAGHRHGPEADAGVPREADELHEVGQAHDLIVDGTRRAEDGHSTTQRRYGRAGERGQVDDVVGTLLDTEVDAITERETALGVGVVDLDLVPAARRDDVAGAGAEVILRAVAHEDDVTARVAVDDLDEGGGRDHGALLVEVHVVHMGARLQVEPTGIVGHPLSDHRDGLRVGPTAVEAGEDPVRQVPGAVGHREEGAEPQLVVGVIRTALVEGRVQDLPAGEADSGEVLDQVADLRGQAEGGPLRTTQVADTTDPVPERADADAALDGGVGAVVGAVAPRRVREDVHDRERSRVRLRLAALGGPLDGVVAEHPPLGEELRHVGPALVDGAEDEGGVARHLLVGADPPAGVAGGGAEGVGADVVDAAHAHEEHKQVGPRNDLARLAGEVARLDGLVEEVVDTRTLGQVEDRHGIAVDVGADQDDVELGITQLANAAHIASLSISSRLSGNTLENLHANTRRASESTLQETYYIDNIYCNHHPSLYFRPLSRYSNSSIQHICQL